MDMNIDEQWLELHRLRNQKNYIVAISNTGKYRKADGTECILGLRQKVWYYRKLKLCHRIIADHFLITVKRPDQICIDHITHKPSEYNVNDVRNLRWCTPKENSNFEEAKDNQSGEKNSMYGRTGEKNPYWKGDTVGPLGAYKRARKEYDRNPTQENLAALEEARLIKNEYQRHLRRAKKSRQ
jgi:hypothetical protein